MLSSTEGEKRRETDRQKDRDRVGNRVRELEKREIERLTDRVPIYVLL